MPSFASVGWWRGEGNARDVVTGVIATATNGATYDVGVSDERQAFQFDGVDDCAKVMDHVAFQRKLAFPHQVTLFFDKYLLVDRQLVPDVKEARAHYRPIETSTVFKRHPDAICKTSRRTEAISLGRTDGPG